MFYYLVIVIIDIVVDNFVVSKPNSVESQSNSNSV